MLTAETTLMQSVSYRLIGRSRMTGDEGIQYLQDAESYLSGSRFENDRKPRTSVDRAKPAICRRFKTGHFLVVAETD